MLDPFTTLGAASAIVQFVQFAANLIETTFEIHQSSNGSITLLKGLQDGVSSLQTMSNHLATVSKEASVDKSSDPDTGILLDKCTRLADRILKYLQDLDIKSQSNKRQSTKLALRIAMKQEQLARHEHDLKNLRGDGTNAFR